MDQCDGTQKVSIADIMWSKSYVEQQWIIVMEVKHKHCLYYTE